jgi:hypothetical protein
VSSESKPPRRVTSCFVAAPAKLDITPLRRLLEERGISVVVPSEFPPGSYTILAHISSAVDSADVVIGVFDGGAPSGNVLFEIGMAHGKGKQVLLIVPPRVETLPFDVSELFTVRATLMDDAALAFAIDQLITAASTRRRSTKVPIRKGRPLKQAGLKYVDQLQRMSNEKSLHAFERLLAEALREGGVEVVLPEPGKRSGADLAIWSEELIPFVGTPLLIDVKSAAVGGQWSHNLSNYVTHMAGKWALITVVGPISEEIRTAAARAPNVLLVEYEKLIRSLETRSFPDIVKDLRNAKVHRVGG